MRVSAKAEYACVAMIELAMRFPTDQPVVQVKTVAEEHGISPRFLVQILLQLKGVGLVASSRGSSGGYQLMRAPEKIKLSEIVDTIDQDPEAPSALNALPKTRIVKALRSVWRAVSQAEHAILEQTTLADLVQRSQDHDAATYQI